MLNSAGEGGIPRRRALQRPSQAENHPPEPLYGITGKPVAPQPLQIRGLETSSGCAWIGHVRHN